MRKDQCVRKKNSVEGHLSHDCLEGRKSKVYEKDRKTLNHYGL